MSDTDRKRDYFTRSARKARGRPRVEYSLSAAIVEALDARCSQTGESKSSVVEQALKAFLGAGQ